MGHGSCVTLVSQMHNFSLSIRTIGTMSYVLAVCVRMAVGTMSYVIAVCVCVCACVCVCVCVSRNDVLCSCRVCVFVAVGTMSYVLAVC